MSDTAQQNDSDTQQAAALRHLAGATGRAIRPVFGAATFISGVLTLMTAPYILTAALALLPVYAGGRMLADSVPQKTRDAVSVLFTGKPAKPRLPSKSQTGLGALARLTGNFGMMLAAPLMILGFIAASFAHDVSLLSALIAGGCMVGTGFVGAVKNMAALMNMRATVSVEKQSTPPFENGSPVAEPASRLTQKGLKPSFDGQSAAVPAPAAPGGAAPQTPKKPGA